MSRELKVAGSLERKREPGRAQFFFGSGRVQLFSGSERAQLFSGSARFPSGWFRTVPYQLLQKRNVGWTCKNNMTFLTRTITRRGIQSYHLYNI